MTVTYTPIATGTVSGTTLSFNSIPQTFRDLVLVGSPKTSTNGSGLILRINADSGAGMYRIVDLGGNSNGSAAGTGAQTTTSIWLDRQINLMSNVRPSPIVIQFMDYSRSDKNKKVITRQGNAGNAATNITVLSIGTYFSTGAITSIQLTSTSNFSRSDFTLYGIAG